VTRVEIRSIDPPQSIKDSMEKQLKAEREKRAAILTAEGVQQSQILTAEGDKQGAVLRAEGEKQSAILRSEGQAQAIATVFKSIHEGNADPKLLAYQYLQTLPQLAQGEGNTVWMIPSELTGALRLLSSAFGGQDQPEPAAAPLPAAPAAGTDRPDSANGAPVTEPGQSALDGGTVDYRRGIPGPASGAARTTVSSRQNASCSRPVAPRTAINPRPETACSTCLTGITASGTAASVIRVSGAASAIAAVTANGASTQPEYTTLVR
jgi:hypothetical protein